MRRRVSIRREAQTDSGTSFSFQEIRNLPFDLTYDERMMVLIHQEQVRRGIDAESPVVTKTAKAVLESLTVDQVEEYLKALPLDHAHRIPVTVLFSARKIREGHQNTR